MRIADEIKSSLTMRQVAEYYGFQVKRAGFMSCPFHQGDNTASMKLYDESGSFYCFGCGAHGTVIDFVMRLFDLNFRQACLRINSDFSLGLTGTKPDKEARSRLLEKRLKEQWKADQNQADFRYMVKEMWYLKDAIEAFQPVRDGEKVYFHPLYVEAVKRLPWVEYWLDDFLERGGDSA